MSRIDSIRLPALSALLALALAACGSRGPDLTLTGRQCLAALNSRGVQYAMANDRGGGSCQMSTGISLSRMSADVEPDAAMGCALALRLQDFEQRMIQPLARRHLGQRVVAIRNFGAFACRSVNSRGGRLSQHALGQAIDIWAFDLADGSRIVVQDHWRNAGPRSRFLRDVARAACDSFSVVLTPDSDAFHYNHIHVDIGPHRSCDG